MLGKCSITELYPRPWFYFPRPPASGLQAMSHYTNFCVPLLSPDSFSLGKVNSLLHFILFSLNSPLVMVNIFNLTGLDSPSDKPLGVFMVTLLYCIN